MIFKYVNNYTGEDEATIRLYNEIGGLYGINGVDVSNELVYLYNIGVKRVHMRINSPGGMVLDGQTIIATMRELQTKGVEFYTYNEFLCASIAGLIFEYGNKRLCASNSLLMMHNTSGGGNDAKSLEVKKKMNESLAEQLSSRNGKTIEDILSAMEVETWLSASEAIELGFADEEFESVVLVENVNRNVNELYAISNNILTKKEVKMEKLINKFNLSNNANEEAVLVEVEKIEADKKSLEAQLSEANAKLEAVNSELEALKVKEAELVVENAIKEGKIKSESKESMLENAKKDLVGFKNFVEAIAGSTATGFRNFVGKSDKEEDERKNWTLKDWKEKDGKGLVAMATEDPERYRNLFN